MIVEAIANGSIAELRSVFASLRLGSHNPRKLCMAMYQC